jgi:excisionase family DNA binding protein
MNLQKENRIAKEKGIPRARYFTIPEVVPLLGMSRVAIYKKVKAGDIRAIKVGRVYVIPRAYIVSILGGNIDKARKKKLNRGVKRVVKEYGELLRKLGKE